LKLTAEAPPIGRRLGLSAYEETDEGYRFARKEAGRRAPGPWCRSAGAILAFPLGPFLLGPLPGRRDGTTERAGTASPHQKMSRFHPKCFRNAPEGQDRRIALAELEAADVSSINTHSPGSPAANNARPAASPTARALANKRSARSVGKAERRSCRTGPTSPWTVRYRGALAD
jgi:hypothetical protein